MLPKFGAIIPTPKEYSIIEINNPRSVTDCNVSLIQVLVHTHWLDNHINSEWNNSLILRLITKQQCTSKTVNSVISVSEERRSPIGGYSVEFEPTTNHSEALDHWASQWWEVSSNPVINISGYGKTLKCSGHFGPNWSSNLQENNEQNP